MNYVKIRAIERYYPENSRSVDEIIKEFKQRGEDISFFVEEFLGKKTLHLSKNNEENSLTMAIEVAKKILVSTGLKGEDMDMIVLSSTPPEYLSPPCALLVHKAINGKTDAICYDINVNCLGMTFAFNQISKQMLSEEKINRVLLIGADYVSHHTKDTCSIMHPNLGDAACAIILEKTNKESGIIDIRYHIDTEQISKVRLPICGMSHIREAEKEDLYGEFKVELTDASVPVNHIKDILEKNNLEVKDISMFCFSQFAIYHTEYIRNRLKIEEEHSLYIGDCLGYTGTSSPFLVLYEALKQQKVKRGDYIIIWTMGAAMQHMTILFKY